MKNYWASYWVPVDRMKYFEYWGPWWISGETINGDMYSIVFAVQLENSNNIRQTFKSFFDSDELSEGIKFRFCNIRHSDWTPFGSNRFEKADWMIWPMTQELNSKRKA